MERDHTDREYEGELRKLRDGLLQMGVKVEELIANSVRALVERDSGLARRMMAQDDEINRIEVETDGLCLRILARRQPVASDLRAITIAMKMVTDLERIGDLGVNICERVVELNAEPPLRPYPDLPRMAGVVQGMVREALDAFVERDAERAERVIAADRTVDACYAQVFRELMTWMMEDVGNICRVTRLQSIAKYLERIGDHATNLAEMVVFMVRGKDIRHVGRTGAAGRVQLPRGVLFASQRNDARSQMAEGLARRLLPQSVRVFSAGSAPAAAVSPDAVAVMGELGIDITGQRPKGFSQVPMDEVDTVVVLGAQDGGAAVPGAAARRAHWPLTDVAGLEVGAGQRLSAFRRVRDELRTLIESLKPI